MHSTLQWNAVCCGFAVEIQHIQKMTMKTMTTDENNGGNAACRKRLVYMYHCACLTARFTGIPFVEV